MCHRCVQGALPPLPYITHPALRTPTHLYTLPHPAHPTGLPQPHAQPHDPASPCYSHMIQPHPCPLSSPCPQPHDSASPMPTLFPLPSAILPCVPQCLLHLPTPMHPCPDPPLLHPGLQVVELKICELIGPHIGDEVRGLAAVAVAVAVEVIRPRIGDEVRGLVAVAVAVAVAIVVAVAVEVIGPHWR